jgi:hypothetical protein
MKKSIQTITILLTVIISSVLIAQTPQYYNSSATGTANGFPFGIPQGKMVQMLYLANDFSLPTPCPPGYISNIYFKMTGSGSSTYTTLTIRMGQSSITELPVNKFYDGRLDTVYNKSNIALTATTGGWMSITLDSAYNYNPSQSLIVEVQQCGGTGALYAGHLSVSGIRRSTSLINTSCPFVWGQQSGTLAILGIDVTITNIKPVSTEIPKDFSLEQNYPNPFNPTTDISFNIAKAGLVKLEIFDILGKSVALPVNEQLSAGKYSTNFDASNLTSGIYIYTLIVNNFSESKRMMLIK